MASSPSTDRYHLKSVHAEIDLFDRRLAHLQKYDVFASEAERAAAERKLNLKRDPLVATARRLADEGVEYKDSELPRSFRPDGMPAPVVTKPEPIPAPEPFVPAEMRSGRSHGSPYAGTSLDWEKSVQHYMQNKAARA